MQLTGVGSCTITASQAGDSTYFAATPVARTFTIIQANQAITFGPAPTGVTVGLAAGHGHRDELEPDGAAVDDADHVHLADAGRLHDGRHRSAPS